MNNKRCFYLFLVAGIVAGMFSQSLLARDFEIAEKYIASYSNFDLVEMEKYYSEDATFKDLTSEGFGDNAFVLEGRHNIIEKFSNPFFQTSFRLNYKFSNTFESSGHHVFNSDVTARTTTKEGISYSCGNVVTIIKIVNNKVVSHVDYADYDNFTLTAKNNGEQCRKF